MFIKLCSYFINATKVVIPFAVNQGKIKVLGTKFYRVEPNGLSEGLSLGLSSYKLRICRICLSK